jgi:hypothetical protein
MDIMEQHPVPQNVTTFQFRLIGEMTIKQFAYVAVGVMVAFIFYKLPFPNIITWPLAGFSCLFGFGLAFVPIEERPMDVWVLSFLRSIYSPTLYVWQKEEKTGEQTMQQQSAPPIPLAPAEALQQKTASAENDPYIAANQALDRVLQANGLGAAIKTAGAHEDLALADAVQHLAQNDDLYNAALSLKVAEAEEIERWLQSQPLA